jgi:hypothetical protein
MKPTQRKLSRRTFLLAAGAGGAATTAALVTRSLPDAPADKQKNIRQSKGYQLTEHVQNYYRTAKV